MKKYYIYSIFCCLLACFSACSNDDLVDNEVGYLHVAVETATSTNVATKSAPVSGYNPKQLQVEILNVKGEIATDIDGNLLKTNNFSDWQGKQFALRVGSYTIKASSYGFDGNYSGFDIPYYVGSKKIVIEKDKDIQAEVTCTLANVKVTVNFDSKLQAAFKSGNVQVSSAVEGINPQTFTMGAETKSAYFPVGDLTADLTLVNQGGTMHTMSKTFTDVQARDHYILNYKLADSGNGNINVTVDAKENTYTWDLEIPTTATTTLRVSAPNAWSTFAYLEGDVTSKAINIDASKMQFEYKTADAQTWTEVTIGINTAETDHYELKLTGLTPNTTYVYRMVYPEGDEYPTSNEMTFTTEAQTTLYNGGFENWTKGQVSNYGSAWYPNASDMYFWDTSNPGSTTMGESYNVTTKSTDVKHGGSAAAKLASDYIVIKFAAASIYTGSFVELVGGTKGAKLNWGREFSSRPTNLKGWFQYAPETINRGISNVPSDVLEKAGVSIGDDTPDWCSIFIALTTKSYTVDNTNMSTFPDFNTDPGVVAYGELPIAECISTNGEWKEFNIELKYHDLNTKPTHIIVVSSSSKFGDYFTGSDGSVLYLDDFELVYGDNPAVKE